MLDSSSRNGSWVSEGGALSGKSDEAAEQMDDLVSALCKEKGRDRAFIQLWYWRKSLGNAAVSGL